MENLTMLLFFGDTTADTIKKQITVVEAMSLATVIFVLIR